MGRRARPGPFYTVAITEPLAQPHTLPLLASLSVAEQLRRRYGVQCQIKWPNDLLLNGKKLCGILCEGVEGGVVCGIGLNLAQSAAHFAALGLPHATSLALEGAAVDLRADPEWLAHQLTDFGFDRPLYTFASEGFAPYRAAYRAACVNLGRRVWFDGGSGVARDVDGEGRLVVQTDEGDTAVFTGEVSVHGIYGQV